MPGLGRRTFAPGEVLTATNVMGYLQDQAVMNFSDDGARGSAIGTAVSEGMVSYLADSDIVEVYNGSAWKQLAKATGSVLQVVQGTTATGVANSTTTYADTGLSASITPISANSKVLVLVSQNGLYKTAGSSANSIYLKLLRGATDLQVFAVSAGFDSVAIARYLGGISTAFLDSPATTSAVTYKTQFRNETPAASVSVNFAAPTSAITLIEVAG